MTEAFEIREAKYRLDVWARVQRAELAHVDYPSETPYLKEHISGYRENTPDTSTDDETEANRVGWCLNAMIGPYSAERTILIDTHMNGGRRARGYHRALGVFARTWADWSHIWNEAHQAQ